MKAIKTYILAAVLFASGFLLMASVAKSDNGTVVRRQCTSHASDITMCYTVRVVGIKTFCYLTYTSKKYRMSLGGRVPCKPTNLVYKLKPLRKKT
jgi:hypothetical protein